MTSRSWPLAPDGSERSSPTWRYHDKSTESSFPRRSAVPLPGRVGDVDHQERRAARPSLGTPLSCGPPAPLLRGDQAVALLHAELRWRRVARSTGPTPEQDRSPSSSGRARIERRPSSKRRVHPRENLILPRFGGAMSPKLTTVVRSAHRERGPWTPRVRVSDRIGRKDRAARHHERGARAEGEREDRGD